MICKNIWIYDEYNFRRFKPGDIDYYLDIGGCIGTSAVMFKVLVPGAKVISVEPCKEDFEVLKVAAGTWNIDCHNIALGDGKPMCFHHRRQGSHRLYSETEKKWWPKDSYMVESMTFSNMFKKFKVKGRYVIKVDTEGGERFLLDDNDAVDIIKGSVQFNFEYHFGIGGPKKQWDKWFKNFSDTHNMFVRTKERNEWSSNYVPATGLIEINRIEYMLVKK